jgi:cell division septation protein DedD/nucleoid DNA-binding protein
MKINIASHISELLYRHNQVNVPGLGGFYAAYRETTIDKYGNILPPSKELRFDERSIFHDDKLIQSLVNEYDLTFAEAIEVVEDFVKSVKSDLQNKAVVISTIGRLYLDARSEIVLAPSSQNFLEDSFGLPKLQKHLISRHPEKEKIVPPVVVETVVMPQKVSKFRRVFAGIWGDSNLRMLIIIVAVFMLVVPQLYRLANPTSERIDPSIVEGDSELITENQSNLIDKNATFNPFEKTVNNNGETLNETPENDKIIPKEITEDAIEDPAKKINLESETSEKPVAEDPAKPVATTPKPKANTKDYIIAIGNFSTQDNANFAIKGVQKAGYKSYSTKVSADKIRVGVAINCTANEIDAKLLQVKKKYPGSWLMNR